MALENARLVHETRQRNAELALINSVQDAIAGELDPQAIYDAVGDRIREIFDAQVVAIMTLDEATGLDVFPYIIERGERLAGRAAACRADSRSTSRDAGAVADHRERRRAGRAVRERRSWPARSRSRSCSSRSSTGGKATGVISLQNVDREHAYSESDQQLLETLAGSLSVALENARLVHETRQRNAELALINGVQDAIAGELDRRRSTTRSAIGSGTSSTRRSSRSPRSRTVLASSSTRI